MASLMRIQADDEPCGDDEPCAGESDPGRTEEDMKQQYEEDLAASPLVDIVRRWQAPFDGKVNVDATFNLIQISTPDRELYEFADGVRITVQHNEVELWSYIIYQDTYSSKKISDLTELLKDINVVAGDRIYFRVQSQYDGAYDVVKLDPVINYNDVDLASIDQNGASCL